MQQLVEEASRYLGVAEHLSTAKTASEKINGHAFPPYPIWSKSLISRFDF